MVKNKEGTQMLEVHVGRNSAMGRHQGNVLITSCGMLITDKAGLKLLQLTTSHSGQIDYPKGEQESKDQENDRVTAMRELEEETGIRKDQVNMTPFKHEYSNYMEYTRWRGIQIEKKLIWFLASVKEDEVMNEVKLNSRNHQSYEWQLKKKGQTWTDRNRNGDMEDCLRAAAADIDKQEETWYEQEENEGCS